jgi:hypothetical protein
LIVQIDANELNGLATAISEFLRRHATSRFTITSEGRTLTLPQDIGAVRSVIERLSSLPGNPTIDPPKPTKRGR